MPSVRLAPLSEENFEAAVKLAVAAEQADFVASNVYTIAQAYLYPFIRLHVIQDGDAVVGFAASFLDEDSGRRIISRFMIGAEHQGKGYGAAALRELIALLRADDPAATVRLSVVPGNAAAERLYRAAGFAPTGELHHGEIVMDLVG